MWATPGTSSYPLARPALALSGGKRAFRLNGRAAPVGRARRRDLSSYAEQTPLARNAAQRGATQILELDARSGHQIFHGAGDEHIAASGVRRDALGNVEGDAANLLREQLAFARVQPGP